MLVYDDTVINEATPALFDVDYHTKNPSRQSGADAAGASRTGTGRAQVSYFSHQGRSLVCKHYYRGGMIARLLKDQYLQSDHASTRAFREFYLLKRLAVLGLPVPNAVAAMATRVSPMLPFYRCDLITEEIQAVCTLADYLVIVPTNRQASVFID